MERVLVTGGTSGIGRAFAAMFASQGCDLVLVARDPERLAQTANELHRGFGVQVETLTADLAERDQLDRVVDRIRDDSQPITILVNNAGFGLNDPLVDPDLDLQRRAMDVMCFATLALGGTAAGVMKRAGGGVIINVASVSAWIIKGNYSAIKRWVISYSQALANELVDTRVQVTAVCPGWAKTELHARAGVKRPKLPPWAWVSPEKVAESAWQGAQRGRVVVVPTLGWALVAKVLGHAPAGFPRTISRLITRSRSK